MKKKRKKKKVRYRLKESAKRFLVYFFVCGIILLYAIIKCSNLIKDYQYKQTYEYKLLEIGYTKKQTDTLTNNINDKYLELIVQEEKVNTFYPTLVNNKYYIKDNYKKYIDYYEYHKTIEPNIIIGIINTNANINWYSKITNANTSTTPILLNKNTKVSEDYTVDDLVNINLQTSYANNKAKKEVVNAYYQMHEAVKIDLGINLMVVESYRTYKNQGIKYNSYKVTSKEYADTFCEQPGHSEHQLGTALNLVSTKNYQASKFLESEEYNWLKENAHNYGFIIRYPNDKYSITGYKEPTHFTYVGADIARIIHNENITLDEYYAFYIAN